MTKEQNPNRARKQHNDKCAEVRKQFPPTVQGETEEREKAGRLYITTNFFREGERTHNLAVANVQTTVDLGGTGLPETDSTVNIE